jgi:translation initiation factor IF-1
MDPDGQGSPGGRAEVAGTVTELLPSALYRVRVGEGRFVTAHIADRVARNFVRIIVGDRVRLEVSPVDLGRGRIIAKL